jgi:hypothetical protein
MHAPEIDGTVYLNDFGSMEALTPGRFYRCEVTEAHDYDLVARVVTEASECGASQESHQQNWPAQEWGCESEGQNTAVSDVPDGGYAAEREIFRFAAIAVG